jgi:hypothetical protein
MVAGHCGHREVVSLYRLSEISTVSRRGLVAEQLIYVTVWVSKPEQLQYRLS